MAVYGEFARFYSAGPYTQYSQRMAELLPAVLDRFAAQPWTLLDVACGEGTFAVAMARRGFHVTGVDLSPQMLELARERAAREGLAVELVQRDMRDLDFSERFDLATCWYDSLNYLLESADLEKALAGVYRAVRPGGLFVFDMNTVYGVAVLWQRRACYVQQDTPALFEIQRPAFDYEHGIASLQITGFVEEGGRWTRMDEVHRQRGYPLEEIRACCQRAGWQELACWGSLQEMTEPQPDSGRAWFVLRKGTANG